MATGGVKVTIIDNTDKILSHVGRQTALALEAVGLQAEGNAKKEITKAVYDQPPAKSGYKRTGNLRNSITHAKDEDAAYVGTNVEYAPYVEMGTSKMRARPFIKPAVENHRDEYEKIFENFLKN